jgi:hypothetical protein
VKEPVVDSVSTETMINDDDFIEEWLEYGTPRSTYTRFRHAPLSERADGRDHIFEPLAKTIFIHHNDPEEYKEIVAELGYEQAAQEFDKRPRDDKTRKGNFGEILASEYLRQVEGYDLPVYRLRWNTNPDTSMRGEDILAFKLGNPDGTGREICVTEAKVLSRYDKRVVKSAHKQLCSGHRPRPNSIPFVYSVLRLKGEREKATAILAFQNRLASHPPIRRNFLMLVTGNRPRNPFQVIEVEPEVVKNLMAANLSLTDLTNLVNELFEAEVNLDDS